MGTRTSLKTGTGEMTAESFVSLFNHFGVSKCVFKVVWCGLVRVVLQQNKSKVNFLTFLGYFRVRVYDFVFVYLFRPPLAWHRGLTYTLERKRPWIEEKTLKLYNVLSQKNLREREASRKLQK